MNFKNYSNLYQMYTLADEDLRKSGLMYKVFGCSYESKTMENFLLDSFYEDLERMNKTEKNIKSLLSFLSSSPFFLKGSKAGPTLKKVKEIYKASNEKVSNYLIVPGFKMVNSYNLEEFGESRAVNEFKKFLISELGNALKQRKDEKNSQYLYYNYSDVLDILKKKEVFQEYAEEALVLAMEGLEESCISKTSEDRFSASVEYLQDLFKDKRFHDIPLVGEVRKIVEEMVEKLDARSAPGKQVMIITYARKCLKA